MNRSTDYDRVYIDNVHQKSPKIISKQPYNAEQIRYHKSQKNIESYFDHF